jgi:hypothetical protein
LAGSSAGAIIAVFIASGLSHRYAMEAFRTLLADITGDLPTPSSLSYLYHRISIDAPGRQPHAMAIVLLMNPFLFPYECSQWHVWAPRQRPPANAPGIPARRHRDARLREGNDWDD